MIQVIHRALDILEFCSKHPDQVYSLTEIADSMKLNHATCANILKTLVSRNYIEQMGYKKGYRLGSMAYYLTGNFSSRTSLTKIAKPIIKELCELLNETVIIAIYNKHNHKRIVLHTEYTDHELQVRSNKEKDGYDASTGRLILAYLEREEQEAVIKKFGLPNSTIWREASTKESFFKELNKIKAQGIAYQTTPSHVVGIAVPVFYDNKIIASLGIYLPDFRFVGDLKNLIVDKLIDSAVQLTEQLNAAKVHH
ncbi:IclR family transcriptional regulator C-terminal domain-containing protein [Massilibacteroides sp.]|uniref:IclR family transcriptional regulator n=1 Tax=Massilibacteroides sp. TaxID=2034766 RepID=UPI00260F3EBB|nr:IclR family transcriptional regulator C-terminal domain-containing protein [Massilibacteroides sp.]MDD4515497.1 IclR family transcriptional regulator C-terminal domain-containing protein [Massilibacteroides sp.]